MTVKVLAIDDEEGILKVIRRALEREGYEVDTLSDPLKADLSSLGNYNLILLDVMMPGMDGFISAVAIVPCIWKRERKLSMCSKVRKREVMMNGCNGV